MTLKQDDWDALSNYREGNYLEHYGRLGMKWGQHIFGKEKTTGDSKKSKSKSSTNGIRQRMNQRKLEKQKADAKKKLEKSVKNAEKAEAKAAKRREDILKSPTKLYKNRYEFSQDEINNALKRFEWERKLRDYSNNELEAGKKYIDMAFQYASSAINVYNTAARVVNSFDLSEKPWKYVEQAKPKPDDQNKRQQNNRNKG